MFWFSGFSTGWILNSAETLNCEFVRMRGEESSDSESGRMEESSVRRSLETLCQELNMDEHTATEAMENFTAIWNTYTLEVNNVPWRNFLCGCLMIQSGVKFTATDLFKNIHGAVNSLWNWAKLQCSVGHKHWG